MNRCGKAWVEALLPAVIILCVLFFFCWPVCVTGKSMEGTLLEGDRITYSRVFAEIKQYTYNDLIVVSVEIDGSKQDIVKRLIGLSGDTIEIQKGQVYRNGSLLEEPYALGKAEEELSILVPEGGIFVLGDNREASTDSRTFGVLSEQAVKGKVLFKFWPIYDLKIF